MVRSLRFTVMVHTRGKVNSQGQLTFAHTEAGHFQHTLICEDIERGLNITGRYLL